MTLSRPLPLALLGAALLGALWALPTQAAANDQPATGGQAPGIYGMQALVKSFEAIAGDMKAGCGFRPGEVAFGALFLNVGGSHLRTVELTAGERYAFSAGGDEDVVDVELSLFDWAGNVVATETERAPQARLSITPEVTGTYSLQVTLTESAAQSFCGFVIAGTDGQPTSGSSVQSTVATAAVFIDGMVEEMDGEGMKCGLMTAEQTLSMWGGIVGGESAIAVPSYQPGLGLLAVAGLCGDEEGNIDIRTIDRFGKTLGEDESPESLGSVVYESDNTETWTYLINRSGDGQPRVGMTVGLRIQKPETLEASRRQMMR